MEYQTIVIGASRGGVTALGMILKALPADFEMAVVVAMHRYPDTDDYLEQSLDDDCSICVKQADEKEPIKAGAVYFAPPNYHLLVEDDHTLSLTVEDPVNYARPSIDVLFESAAGVYGQSLVGVILTGANRDGSRGLKAVGRSGGFTIVQSPDTAVAPDMPAGAIAAVEPNIILPLEAIGSFLRELDRGVQS